MSKEFSLPQDLGLWRYGIISPLLHRSGDAPPLCAEIDTLSQKTFYTPDGTQRHLCPDTIRDWLSRYRTQGIDALRNKPRKDLGVSMVPLALQESLALLRKSQPQWTVKRLLRDLYEKNLWNGVSPSKSALYRFTAAAHLGRATTTTAMPVRCFEFPYFGDLWCADFLHGPQVRRGTQSFKAYLHAIIDDATRYVVAARFHQAEDTRSLLDDLLLGLRRFGIPKRFYTDNGAAFRSTHLRLVAAKLGVALPHTPPYTPRGRGKIERFFRTVREGFLCGRQRSSLEKLNADFSVWLNHYHNSTHRMLQCTPLERKLADTGSPLKEIPLTQDVNELFLMEQLRRVGSDGCVRMFNKRFEIPDALPGQSIPVYYLPWEQGYILVGAQKLPVVPLDTAKNALRFDFPHRGAAAQKRANP